MDAKKFDELMKARHSVRYFQKKEIPENTLKQIITTALQTPSWCNSQAWNIYVASGKTLSEIKNIYKTKSQEKIKGYSDIKPGHRTEASQRSQKTMEQFFKGIAEFTKDPKMQALSDSQISLFNAPTIVYLTLQKGITQYSILDLGALEMSILLSAKSHGVDSLVAYECVKYPDVLRKFLKVHDNENIIIGIALGYEDDNSINKFRSEKISLDEACHFFN